MNRFVPTLFAAIGACAILAFDSESGSVLAQHAPDTSAATGRAVGTGDSRGDLLDAESAASRGNWLISAALAERSYRERPDVINEFNLATAYQHTGRGAQAVPLYLDLVDRGRYTRTVPVENFDRTMPPPMLPLVSEEAASRLQKMGVDAGSGDANASFPLLSAK